MKKSSTLVPEKQKQTQNVSKNDVLGVAQTQPKGNNKPSTSANKEERVLVVEDDDFLRELLSHNLSCVGYKVDSARDAETAFKFLGRHMPDIILLDLMLPKMNGFDFLSETKTRKLIVPVVILSNLGSKEDIDMALSLGAVDFIVKASVTPKQIVEKVQDILKNGA